MNISLPKNLANQVELLLARKEYSSRSEVVRTALRVFFSLEAKGNVELLPYVKLPLTQVKADLLEAGHSRKFVDHLIAGLKKSSAYQ